MDEEWRVGEKRELRIGRGDSGPHFLTWDFIPVLSGRFPFEREVAMIPCALMEAADREKDARVIAQAQRMLEICELLVEAKEFEDYESARNLAFSVVEAVNPA